MINYRKRDRDKKIPQSAAEKKYEMRPSLARNDEFHCLKWNNMMVNEYLIKQLLDSVCVVPLKHRLRQIVQTSVLDTHTQSASPSNCEVLTCA